MLYWNKFSRPEKSADYDPGVLDTWWYDTQKAASLGPAQAQAKDSHQPANP
jgi:microcin C transport system substrate-binding protein